MLELIEDAELEKRLEKLRTVKGATPYGQGSKAGKKEVAAEAPKAASKKGKRCLEP